MKGKQITTLEQLEALVKESKCVFVERWQRHNAAAFILEMHGREILSLMRNGMYEHIPSDRTILRKMKLQQKQEEQHGPKLTEQEIAECIAKSGEQSCQACGRNWKDHHQRCEGSANEEAK